MLIMFITPDELAEHRADAESLMGAANGGCDVAIRHQTGQWVKGTNDLEQRDWVTIHTTLPCRITGAAANTSPYQTRVIGGSDVVLPSRVARFPAATSDLTNGDYIDVLTGELAGLAFQIIEVVAQDHATALNVPVVGVDRPKEW